MKLRPISIDPQDGPVPQAVVQWIEQAGDVGKRIDCFDYIPSNPYVLYSYLTTIRGRKYCEWGSGIGIGIGMAASLGLKATGIELNSELAARSSELLNEHSLNATVINGSYHECHVPADVVYVYCWPGEVNEMRERFEATMPQGTWLLLAEGAERITPLILW
ncbi:hypothetical protein [Rhodopirellula sp. MGV]|uniref:hypothetical protein n=1 Tax=Rhodopirellula sp. MGV TaxID=2023130 RepID=UPI000B9711AF|nr:hypothetical protein [Rhodopirellula sp. MGV]OYP29996.1 hypothetical protein CGZ80_23550 [Rhodopirellula sp. MGV]PNY33450.1 hypothetical protein C2E31_28555 [Rhodopirellula baltica]